jgi:hypothetical protein
VKKSNAPEEAMPHSNRCTFVASLIVGLQLTACQQKPDLPANFTKLDPDRVEHSGQAVHRVRLTAKRAEQLGIKTALVREESVAGRMHKVIPAAAVIRDQRGDTWTFRSPDSLVFVRERIRVDRLDGDLAILLDGPPVGTAVVTAGVSDLFSDASYGNSEGNVESKISDSAKGKKSPGTAAMLENGNIKVVHTTVGASGLTASVVIEYKPQDEEYQQILNQVGGLRVGETKSIPPLR